MNSSYTPLIVVLTVFILSEMNIVGVLLGSILLVTFQLLSAGIIDTPFHAISFFMMALSIPLSCILITQWLNEWSTPLIDSSAIMTLGVAFGGVLLFNSENVLAPSVATVEVIGRIFSISSIVVVSILAGVLCIEFPIQWIFGKSQFPIAALRLPLVLFLLVFSSGRVLEALGRMYG